MAKITLRTWLAALAGLLLAAAPATAHPPNWHAHPVRPRIDVIPPLGNNLPRSHAARYNRPAYVTGLLFYWTAPTSREAISWHRASHRGYYADHAPRMVTHYMFPKPWEVLRPGMAAGAVPHGEATALMPHAGDPAAVPEEIPGVPEVDAPPTGVELAPPIELPPPAEDGQ